MLTIICAAHIEQHIGILVKKLLNDTDHGLRYLQVAWRLRMAWISQVEPIAAEIRIVVRVEVNHVTNSVVGLKTVRLVFVPHFVWCVDIDSGNVEGFHRADYFIS